MECRRSSTVLLWFCFTTLCDWFKKLAPPIFLVLGIGVFALSSHSLIVLFTSVVIGHYDCFYLGLKTALVAIILPDIFSESLDKLNINISFQKSSAYFFKHSTKNLLIQQQFMVKIWI